MSIVTDKSDYGSQSTTTFGYVVEARAVVLDVVLYDENERAVVYTPERWTRVPTKFVFEPNDLDRLFVNPFILHTGVMGYAEAHAIIANVSRKTWPKTPALEFRLVKVETRWSYTTHEVGVGETIRLFEREQFEKWTTRT